MFTKRVILASVVALMFSFPSFAELPADFQAKTDKAMQVLIKLAADASVIAAAKAGTSDTAMTNAKWSDVADTDAQVAAFSGKSVSATLAAAQTSEMGKLILRDKNANLVAFAKGTEKPLIFNIATRPNFKKAITGEPFVADKVAPDPTSQKPSVQIATTVKDGDVIVGVLQAAVQ